MIITRVKLKNWRNFREVDISLGMRAFLVGPNASGKSNFLDALRFLRDIAKSEGGGLQKAVADRGGLSRIRCLAARQEPQVELEVHLSETEDAPPTWKYAIGIKQESRGHRKPKLEYEKVWREDKLILNRPIKADEEDKVRLTETHLEQINSNKDFRPVAQILEKISYSHLVPQFLRHPELISLTSNRGNPFGSHFLERVAATQEKTRKSRLRKIQKALQYAVPQLKELSFIKDSKGTPHLQTLYEHWRPQGAKQTEAELSDGTLRLIAFLWSLLEGDSLLLLEEPELSLHSSIVRELPGLMWKITNKKRRQVIISTHSHELLSDKSIDPKDVFLLTPGKEGTKIAPASGHLHIINLLESGISMPDIVIPQTQPPNAPQLSLFDA